MIYFVSNLKATVESSLGTSQR